MKKLLYVILAFFITWNIAYSQNDIEKLTDSDKKKIIDTTIVLLNDNYIFQAKSELMAEHLRKIQKEGILDTISDQEEFALFITNELRTICHDKHLRLFIEKPHEPDLEETPEDEKEVNRLSNRNNSFFQNTGIGKIEIFEGDIGYVKLNHVVITDKSLDAWSSAMNILSNSKALIIDLRDNLGGYPEYMEYSLAYFFDKPTYINGIYRRDIDKLTEYWTRKEVPGKKMVATPLFVLTNYNTFSGAEEFAYDLQSLERATIVGDTTRGGGHLSSDWHLGKNIVMFIPIGNAINPVTGTNWEGVGVLPDIPVKSEDALDTALVHARKIVDGNIIKRRNHISEQYARCLAKLDTAETLIENEKYNQATERIKDMFTNLVKRDILDQIAVSKLGYKYMEKENYSMAIEIFKINIQLFPESANAYNCLGEAYLKNNDLEKAVLNYEKAIKLDPDLISAKEALKDLKSKTK